MIIWDSVGIRPIFIVCCVLLHLCRKWYSCYSIVLHLVSCSHFPRKWGGDKLSKAMFAAKLLTGELDCPNLLEQLGAAVQARSLRTRSGFLHRTLSTTEYMRHSPFRSMCSTFNDFFDLFEFGESTTSFRTKLTSRLSIRGRRDNAGENERPRRSTR